MTEYMVITVHLYSGNGTKNTTNGCFQHNMEADRGVFNVLTGKQQVSAER